MTKPPSLPGPSITVPSSTPRVGPSRSSSSSGPNPRGLAIGAASASAGLASLHELEEVDLARGSVVLRAEHPRRVAELLHPVRVDVQEVEPQRVARAAALHP